MEKGIDDKIDKDEKEKEIFTKESKKKKAQKKQ